MKKHSAFTLIELVFVVVIMGLIGKFGVEFLAQAYRGFIYTHINNNLQSNSASALEFIAGRLQYRIKDSVIVRENNTTITFDALGSIDTTKSYRVLEWVASDIDSFRGTTKPYWSGIMDLDAGNINLLNSPGTDRGQVTALINELSYGDSSLNNAALYFIGSSNNIDTGYGWDQNTTTITTQRGAMHPIQATGVATQFTSSTGTSFAGIDIWEYYKLAWTANAIVVENYNTTTKTFDLEFYYDYQPWNGQKFNVNGKHFTIMTNISSFQFAGIGSIMKIQVCAKSILISGTDDGEGYSLCKEKTIL